MHWNLYTQLLHCRFHFVSHCSRSCSSGNTPPICPATVDLSGNTLLYVLPCWHFPTLWLQTTPVIVASQWADPGSTFLHQFYHHLVEA